MKKKFIILLVCIFFFNTCDVFASDSLPHMILIQDDEVNILNDDVDTYFLPVAIPAGEAIVYIMGALGVVGTGSAIFANADTIRAWGDEQIEKFKVKALAAGLTVELVGQWVAKLSTGVLDKSSDVWSVFKSWVSDLRSSSGSSSGSITSNGLVKAGTRVDAFDYVTDINTSYIAFKSFAVEAFDDGYLFIARNPRYDATASQKDWALIYATTNYTNPGTIYAIRNTGASTNWKVGISSTSKNVVVDGVTYYYNSIIELGSSTLDYCTVVGLPGDKTDYAHNVLKGLLGVTVESDYTIVGGITDINGVNVSNPWDTTSNDVVINWDNVNSLGGVAGVVGGLANGSMTWDDMLSAGNVIVGENDVTIGGDETLNPPVEESPDVDFSWWGWLKDWIMSFFDTLSDLLKSLFIPSSDFFPNNFNNLRNKLSAKFGFDNYVELLDALKNVNSGNLDLGFIDTSMWLPYLDKIHFYIKGFFYSIIVIFNIRMLMWTVRGASPINSNHNKVGAK